MLYSPVQALGLIEAMWSVSASYSRLRYSPVQALGLIEARVIFESSLNLWTIPQSKHWASLKQPDLPGPAPVPGHYSPVQALGLIEATSMRR